MCRPPITTIRPSTQYISGSLVRNQFPIASWTGLSSVPSPLLTRKNTQRCSTGRSEQRLPVLRMLTSSRRPSEWCWMTSFRNLRKQFQVPQRTITRDLLRKLKAFTVIVRSSTPSPPLQRLKRSLFLLATHMSHAAKVCPTYWKRRRRDSSMCISLIHLSCAQQLNGRRPMSRRRRATSGQSRVRRHLSCPMPPKTQSPSQTPTSLVSVSKSLI